MPKTKDKKYYLCRNKEPYLKYTIEEIKNTLNVFLSEEVNYILKELDYPYINREWIDTIVNVQKRGFSPYEHPDRVLGLYLSKMELASFKHFTYKDSVLFI